MTDSSRIRMIQVNYARAVADVHSHAQWLREACDDAERRPSAAHTPGNISRTAGCLDAAREKAFVLAEVLVLLGLKP